MLLKELYEGMYGKINEVDDDQMIKYKDADGESKEMSAKAAKRMGKDHPAKIEYDKQKDGGGDVKKGVNIFDKPADEPKGEPESDDKPKDDLESQYQDALKKANDLSNSQYDSQGNPNPQGASNKQVNIAFKKAKDLEDEIRYRDKKAKEKEDEPKDEPKKKGFFSKMFGKKESVTIDDRTFRSIQEDWIKNNL